MAVECETKPLTSKFFLIFLHWRNENVLRRRCCVIFALGVSGSSQFTVTICLNKTKYLSCKAPTPNLFYMMHSHLSVLSFSEMLPISSSGPLCSSSPPELLGCVNLAERLSAPILLLFCLSDLSVSEPVPSCLRFSSVAEIFFIDM